MQNLPTTAALASAAWVEAHSKSYQSRRSGQLLTRADAMSEVARHFLQIVERRFCSSVARDVKFDKVR